MSSQTQVVKECNECFNRQDWAGLVSHYTEDMERYEPGAEPIRGKQEVERSMAPSPDIKSMRSTISRIIEEGNVVVTEGIVQLAKTDGSALAVAFCDLYEFEANKVRRQTAYTALVKPGLA